MGLSSQFEHRYAGVEVAIVRVVMALDITQAAIALLAPLELHAIIEVVADLAVQLVDVDHLNPPLETIGFSSQRGNCGVALPALGLEALPEGRLDQSEHLIIEAQPIQQRFEPLLQHFFPNVRFAAFPLESSAMIVGVFLFLDLADERAPAMAAGNQAREWEVVGRTSNFRGIAAVENVLHGVPKIDRHQWIVRAFVDFAAPLEGAAVDPVAQNFVDAGGAQGYAAFAICKAGLSGLLRHGLKGILAGRIPFIEGLDQRPDVGIDHDDLLSRGAFGVNVADRRRARPKALFGLLDHPLADLLRQIVDVILRHQHLDAVHELFRRSRVSGEDHALFDEVDFEVEFVDRHPVLEVAIESIGLLDQHRLHGRVFPNEGQHGAEIRPSALFGRLDVDKLARDIEILRCGVIIEELELGRDRKPLAILLFG